jgi:type I site-specific restriction-modification system R (restriction) subunit
MTQIISSSVDREKIKKVLAEISGSMTRIEAERDYIKESIREMSDQFQLSKKTLNKMARVYHKQNFSQEVASHEEFEDLYETILQEKTSEQL